MLLLTQKGGIYKYVSSVDEIRPVWHAENSPNMQWCALEERKTNFTILFHQEFYCDSNYIVAGS